MATDDQQILVVGQAAAPAGFIVPGNGQIKPKAMNAVFDGTNAAGDFLPALEIVSDAGIVVARVAASTVTMGNSAEVTWAPFLEEPAVGFTAASLNQSGLWQKRTAVQAIPSGVLTAMTFQTFTSAPGYTPGLFGNPAVVQNPVTFGAYGTAAMTLIVNFEAGNYDRYIELTVANPSEPNAALSPRIRSQVSPDGDRLTLTAAITGGPVAPDTTVTANIFQASGVNKNITGEWQAKGINGVIFLS